MCEIPVRDIGPKMNAITVGFGAVALIIGIARIATRLFIVASGLGWDDCWILVAIVSLCSRRASGDNDLTVWQAAMFPCTASVFIMTKHGLGRDIWGVPIDGLDTVLLVRNDCHLIGSRSNAYEVAVVLHRAVLLHDHPIDHKTLTPLLVPSTLPY